MSNVVEISQSRRPAAVVPERRTRQECKAILDTRKQREELRRKLAEVLAAIPITAPNDKQKQVLEALEFVIGSAYRAV